MEYFVEEIILGTVIKKMTRGVLIKANELEEITSYDKTNNQYLNIKNIENGMITGETTYLSHIEDNYKKYCISNNDLVITKIGFPPKIMVAQIKDDISILASGNLYIVSLDTNKINPFYLAAYFNSDEGKKKLLNVSVGQFLSTINSTKFKSMEIPLPDMEEQNNIAQKYLDIINNIDSLKKELNSQIIKLEHII